MLLFITAVSVVLIVSFVCSIFESVLLSLTRPQVEVLLQEHKRAGSLLAGFKNNMDVPIAAILILNTAAHTIGASLAGAGYSQVFGANTLWLFAILFTVAVLLFTEIIPKTLGVTFAKALSVPVAYGIRWLTVLLWPLVSISERISRSLRGDVQTPVTSTDEIRLLATLGRTEGAVGPGPRTSLSEPLTCGTCRRGTSCCRAKRSSTCRPKWVGTKRCASLATPGIAGFRSPPPETSTTYPELC